ncbi:MAG TPA: hypothetical protein VND43_08245, partial [Burkholderiales bacterium]|nr:hypothetical protein [Burkholderiales bacterium]
TTFWLEKGVMSPVRFYWMKPEPAENGLRVSIRRVEINSRPFVLKDQFLNRTGTFASLSGNLTFP